MSCDADANSKGCLAIPSLRESLVKSHVVIGDCTLYCEEAEFIIPTLMKVEAVITDPPYEDEAHSEKRRSRIDGVPQIAQLDFDAITDAQRQLIAGWASKYCAGWFIAFCQAEAVTIWRDAVEASGAKYKRAMVWCKPDSAPQFNGQGPAQGYESIIAAWCGSGHASWNGGGRRGFFVMPQGTGRYGGHPTEKPLPLMCELVSLFTNWGETVLDPFMGSGTTGVAAVKLGRKFIGIERERKYFDIAVKRISEAYRQGDLFVSPPEKKPEQARMF